MANTRYQAPSKLNNRKLFQQACLIGGEWVQADNGAMIDVDNPATGEIIGQTPDLSEAETARAIAEADKGFQVWRKKTANERSELLYRWYELMIDHTDDLGALMTLEQGKPLTESKGEVNYAASFIKWFAEEARRSYGETIPGAKPGQHIVVTRQPVGVSCCITPWNFPAAMITRKAGAALAAGCSMIVRPAEATPFTALALGYLAQEAGIPDGVLNVITGKPQPIGETLTGSPVVRKLSFTGSTGVGRKLMAQCAEHIQKISLELGGNAPFIVFDDADLDKAVEGAMASKFRNTGQTCVCANRILVQDSVHDAFVEKLTEAMKKLKVGDGFEEGVNQSALINRGAVEKVMQHYQDAMSKGAQRVFGPAPEGKNGNYVEPMLLTGITPEMQLCHEETFGPLAPILKFSHEDEAIRIANDTPYGLAAYFYSQNVHRVWRVADALESGIIGVNEGAVSNATAPFGGMKASGLGREGSRHGMEEYEEIKYLCMGGE